MGLTTKEVEDLATSSKRFYIEYSDADQCYYCIDRITGKSVGDDSGEPEDKSLGRDLFWAVEALNQLSAELEEALKENDALSEARANDFTDIDMPKVVRILDETRNQLADSKAENVSLKQMIVEFTGKIFELEARLAGNPPDDAEMIREIVKESLVKGTDLDPSKQP